MTLTLQNSASQEDFAFASGTPEENVEETEKILIVDDEKIVRRFHIDCLAPHYQCLEADSAENALDILKAEKISLVVTDWVMMGMSGTALLRRIVSDFPDTHVVMVTGVDHPERALDAVRSGAFDYILKPSSPDTLEFTVERALSHRRLKIAARQQKIDLELQNIELAKQKTEIENLKSQLVRAEKLASVGNLTAGIVHELNNPLGYVSGNLQLLKHYFLDLRRLLDGCLEAKFSEAETFAVEKIKSEIDYARMDENVASLIDDCETGTRKISGLVEDLRFYAKLDPPQFIRIDINRDIELVIQLLGYFFQKGNIKLGLRYGSLPPVDALAGQLNQVWMNALLSVVQFVGDNGGEINVETGTAEDFVTVTISGTSAASAPENARDVLNHLLTPEYAGHDTPTEFSTVGKIIEEHHGSITVSSASARETVVTVRLPVRQV